MKRLLTLITLMSTIMLLSSSAHAQISRQDAIDTVLNHILTQDEIGNANIYLKHSLLINDSIILDDYKKLQSLYDSTWAFFIDDYPYANWSHPCRYLLMNYMNGSIDIKNENRYLSS